jgi:hypothetical protein
MKVMEDFVENVMTVKKTRVLLYWRRESYEEWI